MKRYFCLLALLASIVGGCGVEWFPDAPVTTTATTNTSGTSNTPGTTTATTVAAFSFSPASVTSVTAGSEQISSTITVSVTGGPAPISISGGEYKINNGTFTAAAGTVSNNDQVTVRHTAASAGGQTVTTLTIGDKSATFSSTTASSIVSVNAFTFSPAAISGVGGGLTVTSSSVTVALTGGTTAAISITGGEYRINTGTYTSAAGTVSNGDTVTVRHTTASVAGQKVTTTLTIGDKSATFSSTATTSVAP